jgi:L-ribulose-5-phosphate 4-epimerase
MPNPHVDALPDTPDLRERLIETCRELAGRGHFIGTWGNVSVRVREGLLLTPTRVDYDTMEPADLVVVDRRGERVGGHRLATSEMQLHRLVLEHRADLGAVIHSHAPYCSVLACARADLPVLADDLAQIIGGTVRCSRYVPGSHHLDLARAAVDALGEETSACFLANHGVVVAGRDLAEVLVAARILEKAALIHLHAHAIGGAHPLPADALAEERDRYLHRYGTAADAEER